MQGDGGKRIKGVDKSRQTDSNCRPTHYECIALPTELWRHKRYSTILKYKNQGQ